MGGEHAKGAGAIRVLGGRGNGEKQRGEREAKRRHWGSAERDLKLAHGSPIRYRYVARAWPLSYYQTVFATEPGSAEMPSAGRPFTREIVERLDAKGIEIAPIILHAGVASLERADRAGRRQWAARSFRDARRHESPLAGRYSLL